MLNLKLLYFCEQIHKVFKNEVQGYSTPLIHLIIFLYTLWYSDTDGFESNTQCSCIWLSDDAQYQIKFRSFTTDIYIYGEDLWQNSNCHLDDKWLMQLTMRGCVGMDWETDELSVCASVFVPFFFSFICGFSYIYIYLHVYIYIFLNFLKLGFSLLVWLNCW